MKSSKYLFQIICKLPKKSSLYTAAWKGREAAYVCRGQERSDRVTETLVADSMYVTVDKDNMYAEGRRDLTE